VIGEFILKNWDSILNDIKKTRRNDILNCAKKLFLTEGFHHVNMNDIAKAAAISRTTLYKYYGSIHEIAYAVQSLILIEIKKYETASTDNQPTVLDAIKNYISSSIDYTIKNPENRRFTMAFDSYYRASDMECVVNGEIVEKYIELIIELSGITLNLIKAGVENGELRSDIPVTVMSPMLIGLLIAHNQRLSTHGYNIALDNPDNIGVLNDAFIEMILSYIKR